MNLTSFDPADTSTTDPTSTGDFGGDIAASDESPKTIILTPEQLEALGAADAQPGDGFDIHITIGDDGQATVDSSVADESAELDEPMGEEPIGQGIMPPKPKPAIRGPKDINFKP